jgi:hypothetical protein
MSIARQHHDHAHARRPSLSVVTSNPLDQFIGRLERVKKSGRGFIARCPAHEDKTASLSITAGDDGRVLLHCFAGCRSADVVAAAGLEIADLFVKRPTADMSLTERAALKEYARQAQWKAALNVLALEATIINIAAQELRQGKKLDPDDCARIAHAAEVINEAKGVLCVQSY